MGARIARVSDIGRVNVHEFDFSKDVGHSNPFPGAMDTHEPHSQSPLLETPRSSVSD